MSQTEQSGAGVVASATPAARPPLWDIFVVLFVLGVTSWGGIYVVLSDFEKELERRGWLTPRELQEAIATATLAPGPTFVALGGIIGHSLRGWIGAAVGIVGLTLPKALIILAIMFFVPPTLLSGKLAPFTQALSVVVAGVLIGTGIQFVIRENWRSIAGVGLFIGATVAMSLGVSIVVVVLIGIVLGALLLRDQDDGGQGP